MASILKLSSVLTSKLIYASHAAGLLTGVVKGLRSTVALWKKSDCPGSAKDEHASFLHVPALPLCKANELIQQSHDCHGGGGGGATEVSKVPGDREKLVDNILWMAGPEAIPKGGRS